MNFPFYIAKRYAFSKSKSKAINIITRVASIGVLVSAMAMFVVLSVFSGLRTFSLSFVNDLDAELTLSSAKGKSFVVSDQQVLDVRDSNLFKGFAKIVEDRLLFTFKEKQVVATIKGVDSDYSNVSDFQDKVEYGNWLEPDTNEVVVGVGISYLLSMGLFDSENPLIALAMKPGEGVIDNPEDAFIKKNIIPVGVYVLENEDIDSKYVFTDIDVARELLSIPTNEVTHLEFKLEPGVSERKAINTLKSIFGEDIIVKNREQLNDGLYRMLNTENLVVYLIFVLVVIMALFTLVGALIMIILEKQNNMHTLVNLGMGHKDVKRVFMFQGIIMSGIGAIIGIILGVIVVNLQYYFHLIMIREGMPYPVEFRLSNVIIVFISILVLGFAASYIAASRANQSYLKEVK